MNQYSGSNTPSKESQFQSACNQLDVQIASLEKTMGVLDERLSVIRCSMPTENTKECSSVGAIKSSLVSYIDLKTEQVRKLEMFCNKILNEIQV